MSITETDSPLLQLPNTYRAFYGTFPCLRPTQKQAIGPVLAGEDLILQSATGSGKTEAVLAPCLERIIRCGRREALLYIVPTRALALDLNRRFETILSERLGLAPAIRTGDMKRPGGNRPDMTLTTPESLDVMLGSANPDVRGFLSRVRMVVIDEVHPFVYQYRGQQLAYLLRRLDRRCSVALQKIALSATIADADAVIRFFGFRPDTVRIVETVQREIHSHLIHLKDETREFPALLEDLAHVWKYRKILVFANTRGRCDQLFAMANPQGPFRGLAELHYSNLRTKERQAAEARFRRRDRSLCIATSTLELGIDVGDVDAVLLYEPPDSVSAFLQRVGRANRRDAGIRFWGICRGETAGEQLLRFMGLLRLARQGRVETPLPKTLPSVLAQQIISCLYEKKRISLPAVRELFPKVPGPILTSVFDALKTRGWLRNTRVEGILQGGWRYRNGLLDRLIWSNFPEAEEDYTLELAGDIIADLPRSVVRQLDPGDRVNLAGKRIRVLHIDDGERKRVLAQPTAHSDEKEIIWVGAGIHVSHDVAEAIRSLLASPTQAENEPGLFSRTRKLLQRQVSQERVMLANGIEVVRGKVGFYRYRTFLGSVGNLILQWAIKEMRLEDVYVDSDETGIDCSHWIEFNRLRLPTNRKAFHLWVRQRFKRLMAPFSLNHFCRTLPRDLLVAELTDFIYDSRLADAFARYLRDASEIVSGDPRVLGLRHQEPEKETHRIVSISETSLLAWEKGKWGTGQRFSVADVPYLSRALTGTLIGEYLRHQQCERWFSLSFLPAEHQPPRRTRVDHDLAMQRMARGRAYEAYVMADLRKRSAAILAVPENDDQGNLRPLKERFGESVSMLETLIQKAKAGSGKPLYLSQGVFKYPAKNFPGFHASHKDATKAQREGAKERKRLAGKTCGQEFVTDAVWQGGIGVPDLIRVSEGERGCILEVGDIKSTPSPRYDQKWQIAFYAWLLQELIRSKEMPISAETAASAFLITRGPAEEPQFHLFELAPYLAAFPALFRNMADQLSRPASEAAYQLQGHCVTCDYFECCYREALATADIQLLPRLTRGELWRLRQLGVATMEAAEEWFEKSEGDDSESVASRIFSPHQRERIEARVAAFQDNRISLRNRKTRLFPKQIAATLFLHMTMDPVSSLPQQVGWRVVTREETRHFPEETRLFPEEETRLFPEEETRLFPEKETRFFSEKEAAAHSEKSRVSLPQSRVSLPQSRVSLSRVWDLAHEDGRETFLRELRKIWNAYASPRGLSSGIGYGEGPHVVHFGTRLRDYLKADVPSAHRTDLKSLILDHFDLPAPGNLTLFSMSRLLGLDPEPAPPESLLHPDEDASMEDTLILMEKLWQWATRHLESDRDQETWALDPEKRRMATYIAFVEEERRIQEAAILALQEYPLKERVARFRAMGPLTFTGTLLDEEGRFLHTFELAKGGGVSKFREGDFLKLSLAGVHDLQSGFSVILKDYDRHAGHVSLLSRQGRLAVNRHLSYSLEEDATDWNTPKLTHGVRKVFSQEEAHPLAALFSGGWIEKQPHESSRWVREWMKREGAVAGLNRTQQHALNLPFNHRLSLIQGPPGTGKTHLLGWILIALIRHAQERGRPIRIAVSALTHQAIDQVLKKVVRLVNGYALENFPARCVKWGRWNEPMSSESSQDTGMQVEPSDDAQEILGTPYLILGATGYGLYGLFHSRDGTFPRMFDWVIFDEASQILVPQALLSLIYGKGNLLFLGDVRQLPPIVLGDYEGEDGAVDVRQSVLELLMTLYGPAQCVRLDRTYRMNRELCEFPSRMWYDGDLRPARENADSRLVLSGPVGEDRMDQILDPEKPVVLVLADHHGCHQESETEVEIMTQLAYRLMTRSMAKNVRLRLEPDQLALISPHRAQNNAMTGRLRDLLRSPVLPLPVLPLIDTVERVQGAERDVILFGFTSSDPDYMMSEFLNHPNRFNVAITRARRKLIVVGSVAFFSAIPHTEKGLQANQCFKAFFEHCREQDCIFNWDL